MKQMPIAVGIANVQWSSTMRTVTSFVKVLKCKESTQSSAGKNIPKQMKNNQSDILSQIRKKKEENSVIRQAAKTYQ